jgi:hypothetical protein
LPATLAAFAIVLDALAIALFVAIPIPLATLALTLFAAFAIALAAVSIALFIAIAVIIALAALALPSSTHAGKCNGDGNNTGDGIGKDVVGDKVGMARATRAIITNAVATIAVSLASAVTAAIFIAAAATTIAQCHCPHCSHYSGCCHRPPLHHRNQTAIAWAMATEAMAMATRVVAMATVTTRAIIRNPRMFICNHSIITINCCKLIATV